MGGGMNAITRPPARWHGGKFLSSRQIIPYLPSHRLYTEAFGGARPRTEVLWINPQAAEALDREKQNFHALMAADTSAEALAKAE
jgi:hypothetical protein